MSAIKRAKKHWGGKSEKEKKDFMQHVRSHRTKETYEKISISNKKIFNSKKHKDLVSKRSKLMWSKKTNSEKQKILSALAEGRTQETYKKIAEKRKGYKHSKVTKEKIRKAKKGSTSWMKGKQHTKETRKKIY